MIRSYPLLLLLFSLFLTGQSPINFSVKELEAFLEEAGYSREAIAEAKEYTRLLFGTEQPEQRYARLQVLEDSAKAKGWERWLVEVSLLSR